MNSKIQISNYQLFSLMVLFSLGSSTIFARGIKAKQDAWIVEIVSMIIGIGILWIHTGIQKNYPGKNFAEINLILFGKFFGGVLTILFAGFFFWFATFNFSEMSQMISITTLHQTPILAIQVIFILTIIYLTLKNVEVMGRVSEILMPVVILSLVILYILIIISGRVHLKELQPVLANGIMPIIKEAYPVFATFPYGENVLFLMYFCFANDGKDLRKYAFSAIFVSGIILIISSIIIITVLGAESASSVTIPLIQVIKMINIADIITNIDAMGVIIIFTGGLFKAMLHFYGSVMILTTLFKIKREVIIINMGIFLVWFNLAAIPSLVYHRFIGIQFSATIVPFLNILPTYTIYIPLLILIVIWLKNLTKKTG